MIYSNSPEASPPVGHVPYNQHYTMMHRHVPVTGAHTRLYPYHYPTHDQSGFIAPQDQANQQYMQMRFAPVNQGFMGGYHNATENYQQLRYGTRYRPHGTHPPAPLPLPPEAAHDDRYHKQLIVNYLAPDVTSNELHELFSRFGELDGARVIYDRQTHMSKGYGFVYFSNVEDAKDAFERMNGYELHGKWLKVSYSTNPVNIVPKTMPQFIYRVKREVTS
ncbi:putative RNA recognition motif (a k a RRM RBD or RNP domain) [Trypanosoma vivax]|nr:putative RNA recognition motif (a k a RRM RBD or RNP domain) [Trypanosoma vivax]